MPVAIPEPLVWPPEAFAPSFAERCEEGRIRLRHANVAFVGLARNCGTQLRENLAAFAQLANECGAWQLHIEANDCTDDTLDVLAEFTRHNRQATFHYQILGRPHVSGEFAGRRTIALAEYRDACQRWVRACAPESDYVVIVDWDMAGGWSHHGLLNGLGWLVELPGAYGMASVSLWQHDHGHGPQWLHYDLWALRGVGQTSCYWDTYRHGLGNWGFTWLPPVGSPPVLVSSAFGGMAIYRTDAYLRGTYDGATDCEHVSFHQSVARATGQHLYVCPAMRTVMSWLETADAGHSLDGV